MEDEGSVAFGVLGSVTAWATAGRVVDLKGPRHRAVLARLLVARGRVVPLAMLVEDLWEDPPAGAVSAVRTFVSALRRALEPDRPPRAPAQLLVTEGSGYALRPGPGAVDALRFEQALEAARTSTPQQALETLDEALTWWRGPAYADFPDEDWTRVERARLAETRLRAVELQAAARLDLGLVAEAVPDLDVHVAEHPWREEAWRLLALALYRAGRQGDALAVLRRARTLLDEQLGVDPGPRLRRLEADILHQSDHLQDGSDRTGAPRPSVTASRDDPAGRVWAEAAATYHRTVASSARARLASAVDLLRSLAVTGGSGLAAARQQRLATIRAAEEMGDPELTARVIGAYDVPAIWSRVDDPDETAEILRAAERTLVLLPPGTPPATRARLYATIALESRGTSTSRGGYAARRAEEIARGLDDPALLVFALNGVFMQSFHRAGLATRRDGVGAELVAVSARHGLVTYELLGHLIRLQARSGLGDLAGADRHAAAADRLAERHESPLVHVFTAWYRALRLAATDHSLPEVATAYRGAAGLLDGAGMPGLQEGLLPLALLAVNLQHGHPAPVDEDWGPYRAWAYPLSLVAQDRRHEAAVALRALPGPPHDHLLEVRWCLAGRAAVAVGDRWTMRRALDALTPAAGEQAGGGSGLLTLGPVARHLRDLEDGLRSGGRCGRAAPAAVSGCGAAG